MRLPPQNGPICELLMNSPSFRFTNFDFTKPRRMSYYPNNQALSLNYGKDITTEDREPSLDQPRSSTQSHTVTLVPEGNGVVDRAGSPSSAKPTQQHFAMANMPARPESAHTRRSLRSGSPEHETIGLAVSSGERAYSS